MKFRFTFFIAFIFILSSFAAVSAQVDSAIAQITSSAFSESFVGGMSGDGRLVVFESTGNHDTQNPRNADGNSEIFLFDYAQRRIFQITDTRNLLVDAALSPTANSNIRVSVTNTHPVISTDGKWLALSSNATCNFPGNGTTQPQITNGGTPASFDPNIRFISGTTTLTPCFVAGTDPNSPNSVLPNDGNTEMWLYRIPDAAPVDLSQGFELPITNLSAGTFSQVTNTLPSNPAAAGTSTGIAPVIADDNRNPAINDNGSYVAFMSNRDLKPCTLTTVPPDGTCGNGSPYNNDEIFLAVSNTTSVDVRQITATPKGTLQLPISNSNPSIDGLGLRIAFGSNANNPIVGMNNNGNSDNNLEIFYADVNSSGDPQARVQVTQTTAPSAGTLVNLFNYGKRMSRDGRYIGFESYAELESTRTVLTSFATYIYDAQMPSSAPVRVLPRSDADTAATGGDLRRFPTFTDYNGLAPDTLVFETRLNITATGTVPTTEADGLNPDPVRPAQVYSMPLSTLRSMQSFKRLTKLPAPTLFLAVIQPFTSNSIKRLTFNLGRTEPGTGNADRLAEAFYLLTPTVGSVQATANLTFETGASRIPVSASPVPTPSPTMTPTPTPTPTPGSTPAPTPTPQTPPAVQGVSPGMLAIVDLGLNQSIAVQTAVGSLQRRFTLPIELSGVSMTIDGVACGLKMVGRREITFVVPPAITPSTTPYSVVINNNGVVFKGTVVIVPARPDVFTFNELPGPGGRARIFNATNRVLTREPFNVTTLRYRGGRRVPTVFRLYLTGVEGAAGGGTGNFRIRVNGVEIPPENVISPAVLREPGVYSVDFTLPATFDKAGDVPIVVRILVGSVFYDSRLEDTAPFFRIL